MSKPKKYELEVVGEEQVTTLLPVAPPRIYQLSAESKEKAEEEARTRFLSEFPKVKEKDIQIKKTSSQNVVAIVSLAIACFISFIPWHTGIIVLSLAPSMFSTMLAVALYSSVIIRLKGLPNSFNRASETILSCLTILFCSSFINLLVGDANIQILSYTVPISGKMLLLIAIVISWIGIAAVAKFVWIALFILAALRIIVGDAAMGFWGNIYVISAFLGIVYILKQESSDFRAMLGHQLITVTAQTRKRIVKGLEKKKK